MRLREIGELVRRPTYEADRDRRVLSRCHDLDDLRRAARRRLPRPVFDYVDGAADEEISLRANRAAFQSWQFRPRVLRDIADPDLRVTVFGRELSVPFGLAPTGFTRMIHPGGEVAVARATAGRGLPYGLSTTGTTTIEQLAATGHGELWFQLYVARDRRMVHALLDRAAASGFRALEVTVDTPVSGRRTRDLRAGLTLPPTLTARSLAGIAARPGYWLAAVRHPALGFANVQPPDGASHTTIAGITSLFDPTLTWADIDEIRARWPGPLLIKGPLGPADAVRAVSAGADGIHLSNHGGRQLDRCIPPVELIRPVRDAVGRDVTLVADSGIRHGADIAVAIARGADLCMVGRGYLYGLAAAGQAGVEHATELLVNQLRRTLQLLGVTSIAELREHGDELVVRGQPGPWPH
jgi:L-lactate dehydrogenase (cytochrome)